MHMEPDRPDKTPGRTRVVGLFYPHGRTSARDIAEAIRSARYEGVDVKFITGEPDESGKLDKTDEDFCRMEFAVSIGGDGTFLRVGSLVRDLGIPLFGINAGRLGFLASGSPASAADEIRQILARQYRLQRRTPLKCLLRQGEREQKFYALNEFAVIKEAASGPIEMRIHVDGERLYDLHADGIIVSSATGSTAYALSAGGPIVHPDVPCTVIVPICPHSLYPRPMVLGNHVSVEITFLGESDEMLLTADGQINLGLDKADTVTVTVDAEHTVDVIKLGDASYFDVLRDKLHWGLANGNGRKCT